MPTPLPCRSPSGAWAPLPGAGGRHPVGRPLQPRRRLLPAVSVPVPVALQPLGLRSCLLGPPLPCPPPHPRDSPTSCPVPLYPALLGVPPRPPCHRLPQTLSPALRRTPPQVSRALWRPPQSSKPSSGCKALSPRHFPVSVSPTPRRAGLAPGHTQVPPPKADSVVTPLAPCSCPLSTGAGRWPPAPLTTPRSLGKGLLGMARPGLRVSCALGAPHQPSAPRASPWPGSPVRGCRGPSCLSL